jgi:hypothetical protein
MPIGHSEIGRNLCSPTSDRKRWLTRFRPLNPHIMKFKCNFEGMVRRQESAGVCVACRFQEGKWGVEAAFQATCNAWHVCCCNCANVCGGCCIWRTSLAFPCVLALLQLCPACCCTATAYAAPQLECRGVGTAAAAHAACGSRDVQHEVTSSAHNLQLPVRRPTNARAAAFQVGGGCRQFRKGRAQVWLYTHGERVK